MKKTIAFAVVLVLIAVALSVYFNQETSSGRDSLLLVSDTSIHAKITQAGWKPAEFFKIDLIGDAQEEIFASYILAGDGYQKTTYVVFAEQGGTWKEVAFTDFMGGVELSIKRENGNYVLLTTITYSGGKQMIPIKVVKLSEKDPYGFEYEIEKGF